MFHRFLSRVMAAGVGAVVSVALAQPVYVFHGPGSAVFAEPAGTTMREPEAPREDAPADLWVEVGYSFDYTNVGVYFTTDGSTPHGAFGVPNGTTQVLSSANGGLNFVRNQFDSGVSRNRDWWKGTLPASARVFNQTVKYKIGTWGGPNGGGERYTNGASQSEFANQFEFTNKLAWPGAGAGQPNPSNGYPPVSFWKEEAIFGNTFCAGMLDQNGTVYDFHFPTPGGVYGVGTRNEGYVDGLDTFPPGLPQAWRGQMHLNQAMAGIRVDGLTHWLSNPNGVSFGGVQQTYLAGSNTVRTTQTLTAGGGNIAVEQFDFSPIGVAWPQDLGGTEQKHIFVKRLRITNSGPSKSANVYWYIDPALNGGDGFDGMFFDPNRAAMVAFDNTYRVVTGTGTGFLSPNEYNPTTSPGYEKNKSLYLASAMKVLATNGTVESTAGQSWRDTSGDNGQGWQGVNLFLPTGVTREVAIVMAGAIDNTAGATGTYAFKLDPVIAWFYGAGASNLQDSTDAYWNGWLNSGTTVETPDADFNRLMERGLLATALHVDSVNGGVIAGFHNGAYPYVWPRDAVYAAITLARTGHLDEAGGVYDWMKVTCFRDFEPWGRLGFWKQKYSTDGYVIWGAPQIDETAVFPWGLKFQHDMTADPALLSGYVEQVRDSVLTMTQDSSDSRLRFEEAFNLVYSNNVWEDSYDTFIYSNANIVRGLNDAASLFGRMGLGAEALNANNLAGQVKGGLDARLDWNGENTDVSQLGIAYPFDVYAYNDSRVARVADRINGIATDRFGNNQPLINFTGEHQDTINRYWGDTYWNGGPWFLSTMWYGLYYGERQDLNPGRADIDNHKFRMDLCIDRLGPTGMGAEQIAYGTGPGASLLYPGQQDFKLQTAWPNAWESMSTFVDGVMKFIDYRPDATNNTMHFEPKLPSDWLTMTFSNLTLRNTPLNQTHKVSLTVSRDVTGEVHAFTNHTGFPLSVVTTLRSDPTRCIAGVTVNGVPVSYVHSADRGGVRVELGLDDDAGSSEVRLALLPSADFDRDGDVDSDDIIGFFGAFENGDNGADLDGDDDVDSDDVVLYFTAFEQGC